jgi:hypothetical protein
VCGTGANHAATLFTDASGDSLNPTGLPSNGDVDIVGASAANAGAKIDVTLRIADLTDPATPQPGTADVYYYVTWRGPDGHQYGVEHDEPVAGPAKSWVVGMYDQTTNQLTTAQPITGAYNAGTPGTIVWHVPKNLIGSPAVPVTSASLAAMQQPYAVVTSGQGALGTGLVFTQPADRAPNTGSGASWSVC